MSVLIIGGAGYIGSHCAKIMKQRGYDVVIFDSLELGHKEAVDLVGVPLVTANYADTAAVDAALKQYNVDAVLHFGAYASVADSVANPAKYYENNISGGLSLLRAMIDNNIQHMIFSSSAATYGEPQIVPIPEDHPQKTVNPYGETKLMYERILQDYDVAFGLKSVSLRYFNAAGADPDGELGEDHTPEQHALPLIIDTALGRREKFLIFGNDWDTRDGTCLRDFVHVNDLADAHIRSLEYLKSGGKTTAYNLGNSYGTTVQEAVEAAERVMGVKINAVPAPRRPGDPGRLAASCDKIRSELSWEPEFPDIDSIILHAYKWREAHPNGYGS